MQDHTNFKPPCFLGWIIPQSRRVKPEEMVEAEYYILCPKIGSKTKKSIIVITDTNIVEQFVDCQELGSDDEDRLYYDLGFNNNWAVYKVRGEHEGKCSCIDCNH